MLFSIITPSFNQLDWLRLCVASVRDQVAENVEHPRDSDLSFSGEEDGVARKATGTLAEHGGKRNAQTKNEEPRTNNVPPPLAVEHIIQDAGSPGIEEFAREVGADFYFEGKLVFASAEPRAESPESNGEHHEPNATSPSAINSRPSTSAPGPGFYRIAVHCERDNGMYDAVNCGFAKASGDFIAYLNCDEQYLPGALCSVVDYFSAHRKLDIVFGDAIIVDESGKGLAYRRAILPTLQLMRSGPLGVLTCATFLRRMTVSKIGMHFDPDLKVVGDYRWYAKMIHAGLIMGKLREVTSAFTLLPSNMSQSAIAVQEAGKWDLERKRIGCCSRCLNLAYYSLKKLFDGCYFPKKTEYQLYTIKNTAQRRQGERRWLTDRWPKWARKDLCKNS